MDPIEIEDWLRGVRSQQMQPVTIRTKDSEEIARFQQGLPADYRWVDGTELLQKEPTE